MAADLAVAADVAWVAEDLAAAADVAWVVADLAGADVTWVAEEDSVEPVEEPDVAKVASAEEQVASVVERVTSVANEVGVALSVAETVALPARAG